MVPAVLIGLLLLVGPPQEKSILSREIEVHGSNLENQIAGPVAEMKRELLARGCDRVSVALRASRFSPLEIEVSCAEWRWRDPLDPWAILRP
ncbi:MAG: hypothetical protein ACE5JS_23055 [Nitrospinota bacterium]